MIVVSDTTPLSSLILLDRLYLLRIIYSKVLLFVEVAEELYKIPHLKSAIIKNNSWINICPLQNLENKKMLRKILDEGESAAIALAIERSINFILIDERKEKNVA
ncbi:MAG: hypothetical protein ABI405_13405, partial [Parafilimonas sp.]